MMKKLVVAVCAISMFSATAAMAKEAAEIFKTACSPCHGAKGEGKKLMGSALKGSEFVTKSADADVKHIIQNGRAGADKKYKDFPSPMPSQKSLSDAELDGLVKFLKTDIQK